MCGSPNDAFFSQVAMFRMSLDDLGGAYRNARLVLSLGAEGVESLPERWAPYFENIEVHWDDGSRFSECNYHESQCDLLFTLLDESADISFICDADTLIIDSFPDDFIREMKNSPALCGAIAHIGPPKTSKSGACLSSELTNDEMWDALSQNVIGRTIAMDFNYTLVNRSESCPFYINYGLLTGTPQLIKKLHEQLQVIEPKVLEVLHNEFYGQIGIALAVENAQLACRELPMRFNFPNDPAADELYPDELKNVKLIHYLRKTHFDRHLIFTNERNFSDFMSLDLSGSNKAFQARVKKLTGGVYPFH